MTRQGALGETPPAGVNALFEPLSIAVVGASDDPAKWGHILSRRALQSSPPGGVALVNRGGADVLGRTTYASLAEARAGLGVPLDLVVVCVPAASFVPAVEQAVAAGTRGIVAITAGLAEAGAEGAMAEAEAVRLARAAGVVLVGPNCLGIADPGAGLQLSYSVLPPGAVAVLSQSGNFVLDLAPQLVERSMGVSRFVSLGNQAACTVVDLMWACIDHDVTRAVSIYAEDVVDGREFVRAARALRDAGKPVVLLSPGRSEAAARSAVSHTGSMTSPSRVIDAACAAGGVHRVDHTAAMAHLLEGLVGHRRTSGRRVCVLTDGGGHGAVAADALAAVGLSTPALSRPTRERLSEVLGSSANVANPVDLAGAGDRDPGCYARAVETLLRADEVDAVLVTGFFGGYSTEEGGVRDLELAAAHDIAADSLAQGKPVVVHTIFPSSPTSAVLRSAAIPIHRDVDRAGAVLSGLVERPLPAFDAAPRPAPPMADLSYDGARRLFAGSGIEFPASAVVHSRSELVEAVERTGFPLVLKALGQVHKSDGGGVLLGVPDAETALESYDALVERLSPDGVSVEAMADLSGGVEVIVGCVRDRTFGPVVLVGLGGIHAELMSDTACALAPIGVDRAAELVASLRGAGVLTGARGGPVLDVAALAQAVSTFSFVAAAHPELDEIEINPLLVRRDGVVALDARVVARA